MPAAAPDQGPDALPPASVSRDRPRRRKAPPPPPVYQPVLLEPRWQRVLQAMVTTLPILAGLGVLALLGREVLREGIEIGRIDVPARLVETGLTPEVAARRLADHMERAASAAQAEAVRRPTPQMAEGQPDLTVPVAGLSLRSAAAVLREAFGIARPDIAGEILLSGDRMSLRLRLSGSAVAEVNDHPVDDPEGLLARAAPDVWRQLNPQIYAWHIAETTADQATVRGLLGQLRGAAGVDAVTRNSIDYLTGQSLLRSGQAAEALLVFEALSRREPAYAPGWYGAAQANFALGRGAAALLAERQAVRFHGETVWTFVFLANIHDMLEDHPAALEAARAGLALAPGHGAAGAAELRALVALGRAEEALALARAAMTARPDLADGLAWRGEARLLAGQPAEALADFRAAAAMGWRDAVPKAAALLGAARAEQALGRAEVALATLGEALALAPEPHLGARLQELRGRLLLATGDAAEARAAFAAALALRPDWPAAVAGLAAAGP